MKPATKSAKRSRSLVTEIFRVVLAISMIMVGTLHFTRADQFARIVPPPLPAFEMVYISGVFEILGGVGLLIPFISVAAAWGLIALFLAVFPANIYQALNSVALDGVPPNPTLYWMRLPFQIVLIAWAWLYTRKPEQQPGAAKVAATARSLRGR